MHFFFFIFEEGVKGSQQQKVQKIFLLNPVVSLNMLASYIKGRKKKKDSSLECELIKTKKRGRSAINKIVFLIENTYN